MISLPSLQGVPAVVGAGPADRIAAQCALALAGDAPIGPIRTRKDPIEHAALKLQLEARLFAAARPLEIFRPRIHAQLGGVPVACDCCAKASEPVTVWLANANGEVLDTRWRMEARWAAFERSAPGLASTALHGLELAQSAGVPLFTPSEAIGMAEWTYWMGEGDEKEVLSQNLEMRELDEGDDEPKDRPDHEKLCAEFGIVTRAYIDRALPPFTSNPKRALRLQDLERLASRRGPTQALAAATAELWRAIGGKRRKQPFERHRSLEEVHAIAFPAALRWNRRDPMYRILDDHLNQIFESDQLEQAWAWFVVPSPSQLPDFFAHLEQRLAVARLQERVLVELAERTRE